MTSPVLSPKTETPGASKQEAETKGETKASNAAKPNAQGDPNPNAPETPKPKAQTPGASKPEAMIKGETKDPNA